jgi:predicted metalloprotease with PDZ domain
MTRVSRAALALTVLSSTAVADEYRITIEPANRRLARVEARLTPTPDGELLLLRNADDSGIEGGWARFLHDLEVRDPEGQRLEVETREEGRFRVAGGSRPLEVSYAMRLEHDRVENLPGADELAWARPDAVLWSGRALLLEGAPATDIRVEFALPKEWRATTPWRVIAPGRRFEAADTDALLDSAFIVGEQYETRLGEGDDTPVRIALAGPQAISQSELIVETVERYLGVFGELFGAPSEGRLLLVAADGGFWGGGVMGTTISMMLGGALDASTLPILRFVTVHEAFHLWNANFRYKGREGKESLYWMSEGTASYYTMRSQLGAGDLPEEAVLGQLADEVEKYLATLGELSMVAGGPTKLSNYDLIYSGGFVAAMALDIAIRARSEGRKSLDDVMRSLHSGPARATDLEIGSFGEVVESATGVPVDDLLACCIDGAEELPLQELFGRLGLSLDVDGESVTVERDPEASAEAAARWSAWPLR